MSKAPLSKGYEPGDVEQKWLQFWEDEKTFTPDPDAAKVPFSIVIPPPNVTGTLHMGHALNLTLQDILCRFKRQQGYNVLWVPGTDHAGIATQNVVERALAQEGVSRDELGRERFVDRVWEWKQEYGDKILNQVQRMGASVDWSRLRFTMDDGLSRAVREVFVQLYEQGLIYQGDYIINWCPRCQTALADLEVDHEEKDGGLYHLRYPVVGQDAQVVIATTRPETMLGDTAVAVHPEDERYAQLIGQEVELPLVGRRLSVIADSYVDREFGTGCLKVTPAHDPNDFELGTTHGLEFIKVIDEHGRMTPEAGGKYAGMDRFECRKRLVRDLQEAGFLIKQEPYRHKVGQCYRCQSVIEPTISKQWFVAAASLARKARQAVDQGDTRIFPANWKNLYDEWLDTIRDWCISRQIWWGHRIPAWTCTDCGRLIVAREAPTQCPDCQGSDLKQDEDVLDTWFSSALWPFSTLGWPDDTRDLQIFYPTSVLVTGFDIIFFWVARMMMMGLEFMHEVPFRHVYIHALVRDEDGRKMSKSTGNVIDPLDMIHSYGADSLRFTLAVFAAMGRDIKLSESRIEGYKHFINKIWNAARFALMNLDQDVRPLAPETVSGFSHRFILHELEQVKRQVLWALDNYHFNQAAQTLYQFVWHTYCDWYLEMIKQELVSKDPDVSAQAQSCLLHTLSEILILVHPFIPFVSQEIWSHLPGRDEDNLAAVSFPSLRPECEDEGLGGDMEFMQGVVVSIRNIRSELNISPSVQLEVMVQAEGRPATFLEEQREVICSLARLKSLTVESRVVPPQAVGSAVVQGCEVYVPLEGIVDFEAELARLGKQLAKIDKDMQGLGKKLGNENFVAKAPAEVVDKERARLQELQDKRDKLTELQGRLQQCTR
ncbi:MAG: valine--tRNA ligase [Desulfovermiculus sp.]